MRTASWLVAVFPLLLAACAPRQSEAPVPPTTAPPAQATPAPAPAAASEAAPALTVAVLTDPGSDSPFRWEPVLPGGTQARLQDGAVWAPAAPVVAVLDPGARVAFADGKLRVDDAPVDVPARDVDGLPWADVAALARSFGALAYRHPEDGSVALWPAPMLRWLAANGDPRAPVLAQARQEGLLAAATTAPAGATPLMRVRNTGPDKATALRVQFPPGEVAFGDVAADATTAYRPVPGGVYGYAAYRLRIDGRDVSVPVIDWVGESPLQGAVFTYVVAVDEGKQPPVTLVRVETDR